MTKKKTKRDRAFLEQMIAGLGESLNRLPADRQDLLNTLDSGRVDDATAPAASRHGTEPDSVKHGKRTTIPKGIAGGRSVKCNPSVQTGAIHTPGHSLTARRAAEKEPEQKDKKNGVD